MKVIEFQSHSIVASKVVAVGPVEPDAELGRLAFTIFLSGGAELTLPQGKAFDWSREHFMNLLHQTL